MGYIYDLVEMQLDFDVIYRDFWWFNRDIVGIYQLNGRIFDPEFEVQLANWKHI